MPPAGQYALVSRPATRALAAQSHVVRVDGVLHAARELLDRGLELAVLERRDLAAALADDVVVVIAARVDGLVAGDPLGRVDAAGQPEAIEQVERAVDRGDADVLAALVQAVRDLLGGDAAAERGKRLDHRGARHAQAVAVAFERVARVSDPVTHPPEKDRRVRTSS